MADQLATLIRLAKLQLDERRKELATLLRKDDELLAMKAAVLQRLEDEKLASVARQEGGSSLGPFIKASLAKAQEIDRARSELNKFISEAQERVQSAFEEVKRYEIAAEQRALAAAREQARRETKAMDEVGATRTQRGERE